MHALEDDLVLHYYGDLDRPEDVRLSAHLSECGECRERYRRLQQVLLSVSESSMAAPEPGEGFERTVWARLEPNLPVQRRGWRAGLLPSPGRLAWGAAILVVVIGAFLVGRLSPPRQGPPAAAEAPTQDEVRERILLIDLDDHLERSQRVLVQLVSADDERPFELAGERARAGELLAGNRLYRQTAAAAGDAGIVDLLDQLERVLVEVAAGPGRHVGAGADRRPAPHRDRQPAVQGAGGVFRH